MSTQTPSATADDGPFGPVISTYSRAQAIADGVLVEVDDRAREAGFRLPTALTLAAWQDCVAWSGDDSRRQVPQDESGRLWDVLYMAFFAILINGRQDHTLRFPLFRVPRDGYTTQARETHLKLMVGPGDDGGPVVTIGLPDED